MMHSVCISYVLTPFVIDFSEHFFERDIIHVLVATSTSQISNESENNLTDIFSGGIADNAVCETIRSKFTRLVVKITEAYYSGEDISEEDRQCISRATRSKIDDDSLVQVSSGLVELFNYTLPAVQKIRDFIESQTNRTEGANVSTACVNGFIEAAFCRQCVERTPPICVLTCNALVRGCYSPYYTLLNGQFQELWTEIKRLTLDINSTVHRVLHHTSKLGELSKLLADIESNCGLTTGGDKTTRKEKSSVGIPLPVLEQLMDITGPFTYSEGDLKICRVKTDDNTCSEATEGPQGLQCNIQDEAQLKNGTYTSDPGKLELTTSECDCFDGTGFTSDDETMQTFEENDIHDQGANPVFQPPLDVRDLERQLSEIERQQGNPVRDFLSSPAYTELSKPQETADGGSICTAGPTVATEAGSMTVASLTALLLAFFVAIFTS
ncbi:hypothetical protein GBAR_LOCUS15181 [Geodia barretti]|uniref:Uncharacterized protein n=1 Tax=Geodia barretti TaxID=519541 RepID=A0AA35SAF3_GEOBA|nr:hypothetical protein GBAR_LOCUS15181 [Geodia barretti]